MGKLNIAHHKSYHPYRRDNIERVLKDEEEARLKEAQEEGRMMLADAEARIDLLRQRAGINDVGGSEDRKGKKRREEREEAKILDAATSGSSTTMTEAKLPTTNGHINLFEDLEKDALAMSSVASRQAQKKKVEDEKGVALAPSAKDLNPWYTSGSRKGKSKAVDNEAESQRRPPKSQDDVPENDPEDERRQRDEARKSTLHDPLWNINRQLSQAQHNKHSSNAQIPSYSRNRPPLPPPHSSSSTTKMPPPDDPTSARLSRESSERQRAMSLIARKKREKERELMATPSTVRGDDDDSDSYRYRDVFNRKELEEARLSRSHRDSGRRWDRDRDRGHDRRKRYQSDV